MSESKKISEKLEQHINKIDSMLEASREDIKRTVIGSSAAQGALGGAVGGAALAAGKMGKTLAGAGGAVGGALAGAGLAALSWMLLNAEADLFKFIGQKVRRDGKEKTIKSIRQASYRAQEDPKFTKTQKEKIKINANKAIERIRK